MAGERRGRGWGAVLGLAMIATALSVVNPVLLIFVPLALLLVAVPPHRPLLLGLGLLLVFATFLGPPDSALWYVERGWTLVLAGWFLATVALMPNGGFLSRALAAVGASAGTAMGLFAWNRGAFAQVDARVGDHLRASASRIMATWSGQSWFEGLGDDVAGAIYRAAELQTLVYPALLALASLAALALAWWTYRRLAGAEIRPLGALREFRFNDGLVWLLIIGIALLLLPLNALADRAGSNLLAFMAALYAVRGLAVLLVLGGAPGPLGVLLAVLAVLVLYPLVVLTTFLVGLSDTWLDIRTRRQAPSEPGG
ncbi:MAG: DUF2232 domain-containing protein [Longimicrobiales bacterium]